MNKKEFMYKLREGLSGLPLEETEERLIFYSEMIDDRIEEGLTEEEAVLAAGDADEIAAQIVADASSEEDAKTEDTDKRRLKAWEIVLIVLGAPLWLSLGIGAVAVVISLCAAVLAAVASLWAVFGALAGCGVGGALIGVIRLAGGDGIVGASMLGTGLAAAGLTVFAFYGCVAATKGAFALVKKTAVWVKNSFKREEAAQ